MKKMLRHIMVVMVLLLSSTTAFTQTRDSERLGMALEYFTSGKYHESLLILERLDKQYTLNERFHAYMGICYFHEWDYAKAITFLERAMPTLEVLRGAGLADVCCVVTRYFGGTLLGPGGLVDHKYMELTADIIDEYRNTGGFDIIGSGRTKLEKVEQFEKGIEILRKLDIKALVIIGGDDSNTNACVLAEYYAAKKYGVQVIGCPKTIDGDLKNEQIETSFGFDTACKTYSELIGNIQRDCNSARKYWHFIKLMGRSASHIALECALQTQPNICLVSEEVEAKEMSLDDVVNYIADIVAARAEQGNHFGTVLIPEGLIEFIPAIKKLIKELNEVLTDPATGEPREFESADAQIAFVKKSIAKDNLAVLESLPEDVARQLCLDRDPHGNVQVSLIETEKLLSRMVAKKLKETGRAPKFSAQHHFFGYEGRCAAPSNYDADYCYSLGFNASRLIANGKTGYMSIIKNTTAPAAEWIAGGVPITMMMNIERRNGADKPVIRKALVELDGAPFKFFAANRDEWAKNTSYVYPGPIQYFGPSEVCDQPTKTLQLEQA